MNEDHQTLALDNFAGPIDDRYLEDYLPGAVHQFGEVLVTEREITEFA